MAAQRRVASYENRRHGGTQPLALSEELLAWISQSDHMYRYAVRHRWLNESPVMTIQETVRRLNQKGLRQGTLQTIAAGTSIRPLSAQAIRQVRKRCQRIARNVLMRLERPDPAARMRQHMFRW